METKIIIEMTPKEYEKYLKDQKPKPTPTTEQLLKGCSDDELLKEFLRRSSHIWAFGFDASADYEIDWELEKEIITGTLHSKMKD